MSVTLYGTEMRIKYSHTSPYTPEEYKSFTENQAQCICGLAAN